VTDQDTGIVNQYVADDHGEYIANLLPPGTYKVEISASGFRTTISTGNVVTVDGVTRVDVTLQLGAMVETVEVTGDNPLVNTTSSSMGEVLNARDMDLWLRDLEALLKRPPAQERRVPSQQASMDCPGPARPIRWTASATWSC
jgi:hypothetical protein